MSGFLYIPFWRAGGWNELTHRTQLYFTPLSQGRVQLGIYLYENGGKPWSGKTLNVEIDRQSGQFVTNNEGMISLEVGPGQTLRLEINAVEHEYGTGEVHVLGGNEQVPMLSRGDLEVFAAEPSGTGFELSTSEISITGGRPVILEPGK